MPAGGTPEYFDPVIVGSGFGGTGFGGSRFGGSGFGGSGFGGSVSAARLAAQDTFPDIVQVLERRP